MKIQTATSIFESLASGWRLEAFRLLVKRGPQGMVAGDIASALDISPSSLSFHLKALSHAGLVSVEQEGRFQRYRANIPLMLELIAYLTEECCNGHPETCAGMRSASNCCDAILPPLEPPGESPRS
ncbi:helix-turn-helix transcriptional regulator [Zoogloea sp.]|uniref:ArsR/SmtB family transcription factor n=1 Tax=Zoogloea sp. TaxID=49181 RepID=UPI0026027498|nr:helix-turn-helix transcriptional regulator [Zoogloea sp.]MDD3352610.1 helix-turn-helix transcriptional regulator [Zoogloea sp.]